MGKRRIKAKPAPMGKPKVEKPLAELLAEAERKTVKGIIREGRTAGQVLELARNAQGWAEELISQNPAPIPLACCAGCSWCCYTAVDVTAPEVFNLVAYIGTAYTPDEQAALLEHVVNLDARSRGKPANERLAGRIPCPLLANGRCSVYEYRPLACRGWTSNNARLCEASHRNPWTVIESDNWVFDAGFGVLDGLRRGLADVGLQSERLDLTAALRVALETPDALARWLAGEPIFAGARWQDCPTPPAEALARPAAA